MRFGWDLGWTVIIAHSSQTYVLSLFYLLLSTCGIINQTKGELSSHNCSQKRYKANHICSVYELRTTKPKKIWTDWKNAVNVGLKKNFTTMFTFCTNHVLKHGIIYSKYRIGIFEEVLRKSDRNHSNYNHFLLNDLRIRSAVTVRLNSSIYWTIYALNDLQ